MFVIISYDISDDKRRLKVAIELENYASRVQYSVFEALLDEKKLSEMVKKIKLLIKEDEDSVRIYRLCEACVDKVKIFGCGEILSDEDCYII